MIWKAIVIMTVMGSPTFQLHDTLKTGYPSTQECYVRTAMMIRETVMNLPVVQAVAICINLPAPTNPPDKKTKGKPV